MTADCEEIYTEKELALQRVQYLEEEIHKLLNDTEQFDEDINSISTNNTTSPNGKRRGFRQSYIPIRIKSKNQGYSRFKANGSSGNKPPEPLGAPPNKPPEPSIPPPPGILRSTIKQPINSSYVNTEIDVFSNEFSPQKFLDSLRMTHLGSELDFNSSQKTNKLPNNESNQNIGNSPSSTSSSPRGKANFNNIKFNDGINSAQKPFSPSISSSSPDINEEWQIAENQRVETRRKIVSPSSAFLPIIDQALSPSSSSASSINSSPKPIIKASKLPPSSEAINLVDKRGNIPKSPKKVEFSLKDQTNKPSSSVILSVSSSSLPKSTTTSSPKSTTATLTAVTTKSTDSAESKPLKSTSDFYSVNEIDVSAALAKANNILKKHSKQEIIQTQPKIQTNKFTYDQVFVLYSN